MSASFIDCDSFFGMSEFTGQNPIITISKDLLDTKLKDHFHLPWFYIIPCIFQDGITLDKERTCGQAASAQGQIRRLDVLPLELTVKLSVKDGIKRFNIYRKQGCDLYIDQNALDSLNRLRTFIWSVITYTEKNFWSYWRYSFLHTYRQRHTCRGSCVSRRHTEKVWKED